MSNDYAVSKARSQPGNWDPSCRKKTRQGWATGDRGGATGDDAICSRLAEGVNSSAAATQERKIMKSRIGILTFVIAALGCAAFAQSKPAGVVAAGDLKSLVPTSYFYRGQSASVQMRNSAAVRTKGERYVLAGLVDTSGYASDVAAKYQGLFISEVKLKVGDAELAPGEYGFGFLGDKFVVTDVAANDVLSTSSQRDENLKRPVPLKITEDGGGYRLYVEKKYVTLQVE
jgi:hypothetical protein